MKKLFASLVLASVLMTFAPTASAQMPPVHEACVDVVTAVEKGITNLSATKDNLVQGYAKLYEYGEMYSSEGNDPKVAGAASQLLADLAVLDEDLAFDSVVGQFDTTLTALYDVKISAYVCENSAEVTADFMTIIKDWSAGSALRKGVITYWNGTLMNDWETLKKWVNAAGYME